MESSRQRIHLIAMGGSVMHGLAIALQKLGHSVTGSDDHFFDPSKTSLEQHGLLPSNEGYNAKHIAPDIDMVVLGMHAAKDNVELIEAHKKNIPVFSFPQFVYTRSQDKQRIVIGGSHGKTTITAMIMHVLNVLNRDFDFVVGADVSNIQGRVRLSEAPLIIIEGDEYLSSRIDTTPKFLNYQHHIGLISGIAWDHINVFPTEEEYVQQFDKFADTTPKAGTLIFNNEDSLASVIGSKERTDVRAIPYETHPYIVEDGETCLLYKNEKIPIRIFGKHNILNLNGARQVLSRLSVSDDDFYQAIRSFELPSLRMQLLKSNGEESSVYRDYAHAPSKVAATTLALKEQYPKRDLIACLELHTYSSLDKSFLKHYDGSLNCCNEAIIFYNPAVLKQKNREWVNEDEILSAFHFPHLQVITDVKHLEEVLGQIQLKRKNILLMSSANFGGIDLESVF